ncbi:MAG: phosphatidylserine decarboxylase [Chloroherpetonaceae bacterium]|nr:phosphatidylserine decarboxylase [Chloroherpetonaceae bacterium]
MITPFGYSTIAKVGILSLVLFASAWVLPAAIALFSVGTGIFLLVFTLQFFRDPERIPPKTDRVILSPADGTVVLIQEIAHDFFAGPAKQISIFMSPLDVHVNRNPISGKITHLRYISGEYLVAFQHDSSERNERTEIGIENEHIKVFFKQIAGYVARRIVCNLQLGDTVKIGERFGMIKFGSRVNVLLPMSVQLRVQQGQHVKAGETILAEYGGSEEG